MENHREMVMVFSCSCVFECAFSHLTISDGDGDGDFLLSCVFYCCDGDAFCYFLTSPSVCQVTWCRKALKPHVQMKRTPSSTTLGIVPKYLQIRSRNQKCLEIPMFNTIDGYCYIDIFRPGLTHKGIPLFESCVCIVSNGPVCLGYNK